MKLSVGTKLKSKFDESFEIVGMANEITILSNNLFFLRVTLRFDDGTEEHDNIMNLADGIKSGNFTIVN